MNFSYRSWYSVLMITLMLLAGVMAPVGAANVWWRGDASTSSKAAANYSPEAIPTSIDTLRFTGDSAAAAFVQDTVLSVNRIVADATFDENFKQASKRITTVAGASFDAATTGDTVSLDSMILITTGGNLNLSTGPTYRLDTSRLYFDISGTCSLKTEPELYVGGITCAKNSTDTCYTSGAALHCYGKFEVGAGVFDIGAGIFRYRNRTWGNTFLLGAGHRIIGGTMGVYTTTEDTIEVPAINTSGMDAGSHIGFVNYNAAWAQFAGFKFTGNCKFNKSEMINNGGARTSFIFACDSVEWNGTCTMGNNLPFWIDSIYMWSKFNFGSTRYTTRGTVESLYYNGTASTYLNLESSNWDTYGNWSLGTNTLMNGGTSNFNLLNGTKQVIKCNRSERQKFYDVIVKDTTGSLFDSSSAGLNTSGDLDINRTANLLKGVRVAGDFSFDTTGTPDSLTVGTDTLQMNGPASTAHIGIGSVVSAVNATLYMNTATAGVVDFDVATTMKNYVHGAAAVVTNSGAATSNYLPTTTAPMTFMNGGSLVLSRAINIYRSNAGDLISVIAGAPVISGAGALSGYLNATGGAIITLPAIQTATTNIFNNGATYTNTLSLTGNLTATVLNIYQGSTGTMTFLLNGYTVNATNFSYGSSNASGTYNLRSQAGAVNCNTTNALVLNSGTTNIYDTNTTWTVSGNVTQQTTHNWLGTGGSWTIDSTSTVTSAGKKFAKTINVDAATKTVAFADKINTDTLKVIAGTATLAGAGDDSIGFLSVLGGLIDITGDTIVVTGNLTGSTAGGITGDSLSVIKMTGSGKRLALFPGDSIPGKIRISGTPIYIDSGGTVAGLWFDVDGINCKFQPNKRYTFTDTLACGGLNASTRDSISSQTATQRDTIDLPGKMTFKNVWIRDNVFIDTVTCNRSDSCLSSGGNY